MEPTPPPPPKQDAFAVLMSSPGRKQQPQQQTSKGGKKRRSTGTSTAPSAAPNKRQRHEQDAAAPPPPTQHASQLSQQADPASASTADAAADAAADKQAAVEAFKKVFSARRPAPQQFDYLLVYDFEATTNKARDLHPVEIIELSCVIVSTATASITASYQSFVRPTQHPQLDPFVTELCGIQQHQVDSAPLLADVLAAHHQFLLQQGVLAATTSSVPVTWTEWDLKVALCTECTWRGIQRPSYLCRWVDLKKAFKATFRKSGNLKACVEAAGLTWKGRQHSGLDDARNTANLAIHLMTQQGVRFEVTQHSENHPVKQQQQQSQQQQPGLQSAGLPGFPAAAAAAAGPLGSQGSVGAGAGTSSQGGGGAAAAGGGGGGGGRGRGSMAQRAAQRGVTGVFDSSGKWLGRCFCRAKSKRRITKRPGANNGRQFWSCGRWTITGHNQTCDFFLWASDADEAAAAVAAGSLKHAER